MVEPTRASIEAEYKRHSTSLSKEYSRRGEQLSFFGQQKSQDPKPILRRMAEMRQQLSSKDPTVLAAQSGTRLEQNACQETGLVFHLLGEELLLCLPENEILSRSGHPPIDLHQLLALYYFAWADGTPNSGRWISFAELPDGRFYNPAFQGYTGGEITRAFGTNLPVLERAANRLKGTAQPLGDRAYAFEALPRLPILLIYWTGDEDFPPACQLLFDASAPHYMPTDGCAILGSLLTRRLLKAARDPS
jgi:hypothetical protein